MKTCTAKFTSPIHIYSSCKKGILSVQGKDSVSFLQGLTTIDVSKIEFNTGKRTLFANNKGRILFDTFLLQMENELLLIGEQEQIKKLQSFLEFYHITEDIHLQLLESDDYTVYYHCFERALPQINLKPKLQYSIYENREHSTAVYLEKTSLELSRQIEAIGAQEVNQEIFESLRPIFHFVKLGVDFDDSNFPQELGLNHCISFDKGCFNGQEPIARLEHRGNPNKTIQRLITSKPINQGEYIYLENKEEVGKITSNSLVETENGYYSLGLIKKKYLIHETFYTSQQIKISLADLPSIS